MRKFFNGLAVGIIIGGLGSWFFIEQRHTQDPGLPESPARRESSKAVEAAGEAAYHLTEAVKAKLDSLDLRPEQITEDLARTGKVVRRKAREVSGQVVDAATDARITTAIKAKLAIDKELSARDISVSTEQGHVTLSGAVASPEQVSKAILLSMETDGVQDVTSTLTVKAKE